jgi:enoyl-CoA hydratase/carnithine racemase
VDVIMVEKDDGVAVLRLNRPDQLNTYSVAMKDELVAALDDLDGDNGVRAVVVTGAGRAFCAGMDLSGPDPFAGDDEAARRRDSGGELALRLFTSTKPLIAAINGAAVGVGVTMTLPMDIRLASERATFGFVFAQRGIVLESASSWFLPRLVGIQRASEWSLTGRVFGAEEALAAGLVHSVHAPDELLPAALDIARQIAEAAPVSVSLNRQLLWQGLTFPHPLHSHIAESRAMFERGTSSDVAEGVASFLERRPARFAQTVPADLPDVFDGMGQAPEQPPEWVGASGSSRVGEDPATQPCNRLRGPYHNHH